MKDWKKMSKVFIPLSLIGMNCAFADMQNGNDNNCYPTNNCCPTDCCKPCCVPQPKKCINCECYNPQFYDLQCDWGAFIAVDFLYWYARESNLEYAYNTQVFGNPSATAVGVVIASDYLVKHHYVKTKWDPGVRVGLGWNSACDGWDLLLNWTYFKNKSRSHTSISEADFLFDPTLTPIGPSVLTLNNSWNPGSVFNKAVAVEQSLSAKWHLIFNQIDLELGKKYWVSRCFTLRPFIGIRGAWTKTRLSTVGDHASAPQTFDIAGATVSQETRVGQNTQKIQNRVWGGGFLAGLQPEFRLGSWCGCGDFSIYGSFDASLLWGRFRYKNTVFNHDEILITVTEVGAAPVSQFTVQEINPVDRAAYHRMQGIVDLGIGLRWEMHWCCDRFMTSIDLGWEHHYWWDFGLYYKPTATVFDFDSFAPNRVAFTEQSSSTSTNLGFGGFVLRFRFDF